MRWMFLALTAVIAIGGAASTQEKPKDKAPEKPKEKPKEKAPAPPLPSPTAKLSYGSHERQVIDFWKANTDKPAPVVLYIHGGGWRGGDKSSIGAVNLKRFLDAGISVAAINYRYVQQAQEMKVEPPVKGPLHDAARALQTIRSKAGEWNINKERIGATGGSAGACSSLWLAFHDNLGDAKSADPIARESTRLYCAAVNGAQTSLDPKELTEWIPNYGYGAHAFGLASYKELAEKREKVLPWIKEYSPIEHVSKDDPPIGLFYNKQDTPPKLGTAQKDPTHSGVMGVMLAERLKKAGVDCVLVHQDVTDPPYKTSVDYLIDRLKK